MKRAFTSVVIFVMIWSFGHGQAFADEARIRAKTHDGKEVELSSLIGRQPTVLFFFASWCQQSAAQIEPLRRFAAAAEARGVTVLAVSIQEKPSTVSSFVHDNELSIPVLVDADGSLAGSFGVVGIPALFVFDSAGDKVFSGHVVPDDPESLLETLSDA